MQRAKEVVSDVGTWMIRWGLLTLPERYHWEIAARLPISNLGLPVATDENLWESGDREVNRMLARLHDYDESFSIGSSSVLDIGCGAGRLLVPLASSGAEAYGIDASRAFLKQCRNNADSRDVDVTLAQAEDGIPEFETEFDLIFCVKTFQSLRRRLTLRYLKDSYRYLADGGTVYLTFPDLEDKSNQTKLIDEEFDDIRPFRNRYFTRQEVRIYLETVGFDDIDFLIDDAEGPVLRQFVALARK